MNDDSHYRRQGVYQATPKPTELQEACPLPAKWRAEEEANKFDEYGPLSDCVRSGFNCADELDQWLATRAQPNGGLTGK